jgi:hypothetical protein
LKECLISQVKEEGSPFEIICCLRTGSITDDWKDNVRSQIKKCDVSIIICGLNTNKCESVVEEFNIILEEKIPYFFLRGRGDKKCKMPSNAHLSNKINKWTWDNLKSLINDLTEPVLNQSYNGVTIDNAFLEQYRLCFESMEKVSEKRLRTNSYFLTINTGICLALSYILSKDSPEQIKTLLWVIPISGITLSFFWYKLVKSYCGLNSAKMCVLRKIEEKLPLFLFKSEWYYRGHGKNKRRHNRLTDFEKMIPIMFIILYLITLTVITLNR